MRCRWLHALGRAGWLGWFALVARLAGWMDYWLSDWLELAELHAWLIHCVCGWLACWLDDRMSMRQGDNVDEISRITWPPLWLFRSPLWPPLWLPLWLPNWLSMTGLRPSKTDFHSTKFAKACVLYGRCRNNCKTNLVEQFGRFFMKIWFEIWQTIWRTIWSKIQTNLVECLKQDLVEHSSKFGRIFETSSRISFQ